MILTDGCESGLRGDHGHLTGSLLMYVDLATSVSVLCLGENGLMVYRLDNVPLAVQKEARLLLFQGIEGFENLSCLDRVSGAQLSSEFSLFIR